MKAIILAAGYATRLYPLTKDRPKPLLPVKGKAIIDYILEEIRTVPAIDHVYVVTNEKFHSHFDDWAKDKDDVTVINDGTSTEETRLGAIGDIMFTVNQAKIDDELCIIAGDNLFTYRLADFYNYYREKAMDCVIGKRIDDVNLLRGFAVAKTDSDDKITLLVEKPQEPPSDLAIFAAYLYRRETISQIREYLEQGNKPDAPGFFVEWLYKRQPVYAYSMEGECFDIGTPQAYQEANQNFVK